MRQFDVCSQLLQIHPRAVDERDRSGQTYLHAALSAGAVDDVETLIKLGVDVNARMHVRCGTHTHTHTHTVTHTNTHTHTFSHTHTHTFSHTHTHTTHTHTQYRACSLRIFSVASVVARLLQCDGVNLEAMNTDGRTALGLCVKDKVMDEICYLLLQKGAGASATKQEGAGGAAINTDTHTHTYTHRQPRTHLLPTCRH